MPRARSSDPRHYSNYQNGNVRYLDNGNVNGGVHHHQDMKRFGSEPDLRHSPRDHHQRVPIADNHRHHGNYHAHERESRYKSKKKYKAPAPPMNLVDGSSPDSYKWELNGHHHDYTGEDVNPPPRKSRLFKTRAETKRTSQQQQQQQVSWISSPGQWTVHEQGDNEKRWRHGRASKENRPMMWRELEQRDRWSKDDPRRAKIMFDGKNTLQRSMSSPEFQAELMQVARKVRNKLNYSNNGSNKRVAPVGEANVPMAASSERVKNADKGAQREEPEIDRNRKINRSSAELERGAQSNGEEQPPRRQWSKDHQMEERRVEGKTTPNQEERMRLKERVDFRMASYDERKGSKDDRQTIKEDEPRRRARDKAASQGDAAANDKQLLEQSAPREDGLSSRRNLKEEDGPRRVNNGARGGRKQGDVTAEGRNGTESAGLVNGIGSGHQQLNGRDSMDYRGQGSGRESTPEVLRKADREQACNEARRRKGDFKGDSAKTTTTRVNDKRWHDTTAGKMHENKELTLLPNEKKLNRKSDYHESCDNDWEM